MKSETVAKCRWHEILMTIARKREEERERGRRRERNGERGGEGERERNIIYGQRLQSKQRFIHTGTVQGHLKKGAQIYQ